MHRICCLHSSIRKAKIKRPMAPISCSDATPNGSSRWLARLATLLLFLVTAAVVLWQNTHRVVLWDLSYILDTAWRFACGQIPYKDFPLAHAPLSFAMQALLMRLFGRHYLCHALYTAIAGGAATVVTAGLASRILGSRIAGFLLVVPLCFLGIYSILPLPFYDCDCILAMLLALWAVEAIEPTTSIRSVFCRGLLLPLPLFIKQNIGLPLLGVTLFLLIFLYFAEGRKLVSLPWNARQILALILGLLSSLALATALITAICGLGNYLQWTIHFATARRMPGLATMAEIYSDPLLLCWIPLVALAVLLLRWPRLRHCASTILGTLLLAAPFLWLLVVVLLAEDADDRTTPLLALWPLILVPAAALMLWQLATRQGGLRLLILLATIHGTLLSQQLWGSTYAIWPLFLLMLAELLAWIYRPLAGEKLIQISRLCLVTTISATLLISGGIYSLSGERLSYASLADAPLRTINTGALAHLGSSSPYLENFEQLLDFAQNEIPTTDGILLLPGEDPFYFATGRRPQFPVLLFDPATDPLSPAELQSTAPQHGIRWLIVKTTEQIHEDPMPAREESLKLLKNDFQLYRTLRGYEIYRRKLPLPPHKK